MKVGEYFLAPEREERWSAGFNWVKELRRNYYLYAEAFQCNGKTYVYLYGNEEGIQVETIVDIQRYKSETELVQAVKDLLKAVGFPTKDEVECVIYSQKKTGINPTWSWSWKNS
ncbi:MAG: hypothetical protein NZM36_06020, partial [Aquificaceae bacterium]|nr:hypothetical protein [Aquificaceae bacterium]